MNLSDILLFGKTIIGSGSAEGNSGVKVALFNAANIDTYEQIPMDETTVLYKVSDEVPSADELLGGFVCAMTGFDCGGVVIPLIGQFGEQHTQDGAAGLLDDLPLMVIVRQEEPGLSAGIYCWYVEGRETIYTALVWGI